MGKVAFGILTQISAIGGVGMVVCGLWMWNLAEAWSAGAERADVAIWSIRCFAVAAIVGAQAIFGLVVLPGFFGRPGSRFGVLEQVLLVVCALVALLSAVAGAAWAAAAGW